MIVRDSKAYACAFRWRKIPAGPSQVWLQRMKKNGTKKGPRRQISHSTGVASEPAITWDRLLKQYGIFWSDNRDNEAPLASPPTVSNNIYGALLNKAGVAYVTDHKLTDGAGQDRWPVAANNGDVAMLLWTRMLLPNMDIWSTRMIIEFW